MNDFLFALTLAPVARGLLAMAIAGLAFPAAGVMVLRLNLIPMRYMLMHGVILAGAISLALNVNTLAISVVLNLILVLLMLRLTKDTRFGFGLSSATAMVFTMAAASLVMHIWDVPAKDTLQLLWGSPFALSWTDISALIALAIIIVLYMFMSFRTISALFFDQEIASSLGMRIRFHHTFMVTLIALVIALAMKLLGALLIDALLILPVLVASKRSESLKRLVLSACIIGFFVSTLGYLLAIYTDMPPSGTIALLSALIYPIPTFKKRS